MDWIATKHISLLKGEKHFSIFDNHVLVVGDFGIDATQDAAVALITRGRYITWETLQRGPIISYHNAIFKHPLFALSVAVDRCGRYKRWKRFDSRTRKRGGFGEDCGAD